MAKPRYQMARNFKIKSRVSGDVTVNSTSWTAVDTNLDILIRADVDDVLEITPNGCWVDASAFTAFLDAATIVGATPVSYAGGDGGASSNGVSGWRGQQSALHPITGPAWITVTPADIDSDGIAKVRLYARIASGTSRLFGASSKASGQPFYWKVENIGPVDDSDE